MPPFFWARMGTFEVELTINMLKMLFVVKSYAFFIFLNFLMIFFGFFLQNKLEKNGKNENFLEKIGKKVCIFLDFLED